MPRAKKKTTQPGSKLEAELALQLRALGWNAVQQYRFHPERRWLFDFAWPDLKVAVEVDGGIFVGGAHTRGAGVLKDIEKRNEAAILGWLVLRIAKQHIRSGEAIQWIERAIKSRLTNAG